MELVTMLCIAPFQLTVHSLGYVFSQQYDTPNGNGTYRKIVE